MTTPNSELQSLKAQLDAIYAEMPQTFFQMQQRDKSAFLIGREIEKLENPIEYQKNLRHWEGHELRF